MLVVINENASDGSMSYVVDKNFHRVRVDNKFAEKLISEEKAIKLSPDEIVTKKTDEEKKLDSAFKDENGKYIVMVLYEGDGPMAYILDKNLRKIRLKTRFYHELLENGSAVKVSPDEFNEIIRTKKLSSLQRD